MISVRNENVLLLLNNFRYDTKTLSLRYTVQ